MEITVRPDQLADCLGMSRTHVQALLDRGEIPSTRSGSDCRVQLADLDAFEAHHQEALRELAGQFTQQPQNREDAANEMLALL